MYQYFDRDTRQEDRTRRRGAATTSLQGSAPGSGVYRALGYRDLGAMGMWERRKPT